MKTILIIFLFTAFSTSAYAQIPKSGTYDYSISFAESPNSKSIKADCKVVIDGNKIKVIYQAGKLSNLKKGDVIDEGIIIKHKSGSWIIGRKENDKELDEVGGCTDGPREIDFEKKIFWMC